MPDTTSGETDRRRTQNKEPFLDELVRIAVKHFIHYNGGLRNARTYDQLIHELDAALLFVAKRRVEVVDSRIEQRLARDAASLHMFRDELRLIAE